MKRTTVGFILWQYLLVASVRGSQMIDGDLHFIAPQEWNPFQNISDLPQDPGEAFISSGTIWNISPLGSSSSSTFKKEPPEVNCTESGLFFIRGSCEDFYYCQDLTGDGLEWSIFWFTCLEGKVFDNDTKNCSHPSSVPLRPECQKRKDFTDGVTDTDNEVLVPEDSSEVTAGPVGVSGEIQIQNRRKRSARISEAGGESAGGQVIHGDLHVIVPQEWNPLQSIPDPPQVPGEAFISSGIMWNISPSGSSSSSTSKKEPPEVNCTESGIFSIRGSCKDFYYCEDLTGEGLEWSIFWFTCPERKVFDDESKKCSPPSSVTLRPECQREEYFTDGVNDADNEVLLPEDSSEPGAGSVGISRDFEIQNRRKRSAAIFDARGQSSGQKVVDILAQSSNETCIDVRNVDDYIRHINSKRPLNLPSFNEEVYTNIMKEYNRNLGNAQENCHDWRNRNSVLDALIETYNLTKEFEPKFRDRFHLINKRVETLLEKEKLDIEGMEEAIKVVKEEISRTEAVIKATINVKVSEYILVSIEANLKEKREELTHLTQEYEKAKAKGEKEYEELIEFLEYVKKNAIDIQNKAEDTRLKMETFQENMIKDSAAFNRTHKKAQDGIKSIQQEKRNNNEQIANINGETARLRTKVQTENNRAIGIDRQLENSKKDLIREGKRLQRHMASARNKALIGAALLIIPVVGWVAGGVLIGIGFGESSSILRQHENAVNQYHYKLTVLQRQIDRLNNEIKSAHNKISSLNSRTDRLQRELIDFGTLDNDLQSLQDDVDTIRPFLDEAIDSIKRIKTVFREAETELEDLIHKAREAKTKTQKRIIKYFMYHETDTLKSHWNNAKERIISIGECVSVK